MIDIERICCKAVESLKEGLGGKLEAVVLFGSHARREASEKSDLDFFVVTSGLNMESVKRRRKIYSLISRVREDFKGDITVCKDKYLARTNVSKEFLDK